MNRFLHWVGGKRALTAIIPLLGITSSAFAQVDYVQAIPMPTFEGSTIYIDPVTQAPFVTGDPSITSELPPLINRGGSYYILFETLELYSVPYNFDPTMKINGGSRFSWPGQDSAGSDPMVIFTTALHQIVTYDMTTNTGTSPYINVDYDTVSSIAARSLTDPVSAILDSQHYTINLLTGEATAMPLAGVDMDSAQFMSYGADGMLYVLDYGNNRIASFNPDDNFAPVSSFNLQTGVTTANEQFAIGINGSFYLGDGLGGGSYYNSAGVFQGVFSLPGDAVTSPFAGQSYLTTGADGSVYVYETGYGLQQYQDTGISPVPEPSTWALIGLGALGVVLAKRRLFSRRALAVSTILCGLTSSAFAQVDFVRDLTMPTGSSSVLASNQSPFDAGGTNVFPYLTTSLGEYYILDQATGLFSGEIAYPFTLKLNPGSALAWAGQSAAGPALLATTSITTIATYTVDNRDIAHNPLLSGDYDHVSSLAGQSPQNLNGTVSMIADSVHYSVNLVTGEMTAMPLSGVDMDSAQFMTYGADGLLYVLDYANNRIASFDPDNAFAPVSSFNLETGVTTANEQFAIGINGSFYLADGLSGGSYYNSLGQYQGVFSLPGNSVADPYTGQSFINTDASGDVYVYDSTTGLHEYQDLSAVPEPSTWALLGLGALGAALAKRRRFSRRALAVSMVLCGLTSSAFAQVDFVRDLAMPGDATNVLASNQSPFDAGGTNVFPYLVTSTGQYYILNEETGVWATVAEFPPTLRLNPASRLAWVGQSAEGPVLLAITAQLTIATYTATATNRKVTDAPLLNVDYSSVSSLAAQSLNGSISMIADSVHYSVNRVTGDMTAMPLAGVDMDSAQFMSYGADGLLYVLDYGNNRVASFDPDNSFAAVSSFNLETGVTTANDQFAIGINGSFYLEDGLGGGSYYNSAGVFQGVFTLPGNSVAAPYTGASFINTDASGDVYVYDAQTGLHEYQDVSAVPEPSTWALLGLGVLGVVLAKRRQFSRRALAVLIALGGTAASAFAQLRMHHAKSAKVAKGIQGKTGAGGGWGLSLECITQGPQRGGLRKGKRFIASPLRPLRTLRDATVSSPLKDSCFVEARTWRLPEAASINDFFPLSSSPLHVRSDTVPAMNLFSRWTLAALIALGGITSSAFAQVDYVQDIAIPTDISDSQGVLSTSQSPFDAEGTNALPNLTSVNNGYSVIDLSTGEAEFSLLFPVDIRLSSVNSLATWVGESSTGPQEIFVTALRQILIFNVNADATTSAKLLSFAYSTPYSLAALSAAAPVSLLADGMHFTIDPSTGVGTEMPLAGVDTATTHFMAYGADGLLYVLDYGNERIASFDPDNNFAPVTSFTLETGVTTANEQFAIGINGSFYLADGLGGGSWYNSAGVFQGVFTLPGDSVAAPYTGKSFINADANGAILVYDNATGLHEYQDVSPVPEPSTWAMLLLGALGAVLAKRRQFSRRALTV